MNNMIRLYAKSSSHNGVRWYIWHHKIFQYMILSTLVIICLDTRNLHNALLSFCRGCFCCVVKILCVVKITPFSAGLHWKRRPIVLMASMSTHDLCLYFTYHFALLCLYICFITNSPLPQVNSLFLKELEGALRVLFDPDLKAFHVLNCVNDVQRASVTCLWYQYSASMWNVAYWINAVKKNILVGYVDWNCHRN